MELQSGFQESNFVLFRNLLDRSHGGLLGSKVAHESWWTFKFSLLKRARMVPSSVQKVEQVWQKDGMGVQGTPECPEMQKGIHRRWK